MNRLDKLVVFHPLKREELDEVLEIFNPHGDRVRRNHKRLRSCRSSGHSRIQG
jgi:ATP-dependent Clp protease ATP-binding subunit ClpA